MCPKDAEGMTKCSCPAHLSQNLGSLRYMTILFQELYFTFRMPDGRTIKEKITVTDTEEDIIVLGQDTRIIYDYKKVHSRVLSRLQYGMNDVF